MAKSEKNQQIKHFSRLGKEIKISPKSRVSVSRPGATKEYFIESVSIPIKIGDDHTAELSMDIHAWEALKNGEEINITTTKEFSEKYG